jgi:hypothetical protein
MSERRRVRLVRAVVGAGSLVVLASVARADAPQDQYNLFNSNSDVIQDLQTGLIWQRYPSTTPMVFGDAAAYCATLQLNVYSSGWRVPSYKELLTLVNEVPDAEYENGKVEQEWIDGNAFPFTVIDLGYWSSSMYPAKAGYAYTVDFSDGTAQQQNTVGMLPQLVRCVH